MIGIIFQFAGDFVEVRVDGTNILFRSDPRQGFGTIENLKLSMMGVLREFPDLKGNINWREEAIKRFKEKIKEYKTEMERAEYIKEDLRKHGYIPHSIQVQGFRPQRIK